MTTTDSKDARRHLLSVADLGVEDIEEILRVSDAFVEVGRRSIPKVPSLRGRTVVTLFAEQSTRTRLSFETAATRLSADVLSFSVDSSSLKKGESLRDSVETVAAMGVDAFVVRHPSAGAPAAVARWVDASVINAGDGWHEHPTQALLDCYTIRSVLAGRAGTAVEQTGVECFAGLRVAIVGDVRHSRVARSLVRALGALGSEITLVAPGTLLPPSLEGWPVVGVSHDLDAVLGNVDVCYLLRLQQERGTGAYLPSTREYRATFGLTARRAALLGDDAIVMHAGPMNRGVEIDDEVAGTARSWWCCARWPTVWPCAWPCSSSCSANPVPPGRCWASREWAVARYWRRWGIPLPMPEPVAAAARDTPGRRAVPTVVIRGGTVVDATGERDADVLVRDGVVVAVGERFDVPRGATVLDAGGCVVAPGLVDLHAHLREPGGEDAETVESGGRAAARGGYTAVVAMPNTSPPVDDAAVAREVLTLGLGAPCQVAVAGAITMGRAGERLAPMGELAALGVRLFADDGTGVQDAGVMRRALEYARGLDVTLGQHCEEASLAAGGHMHEGEWSSRLGVAGIPAEAEELMVARDIALARLTGGRVHFLHLSTARAVALVTAAKAEGLPVTAEVTPHHLSLDPTPSWPGTTPCSRSTPRCARPTTSPRCAPPAGGARSTRWRPITLPTRRSARTCPSTTLLRACSGSRPPSPSCSGRSTTWRCATCWPSCRGSRRRSPGWRATRVVRRAGPSQPGALRQHLRRRHRRAPGGDAARLASRSRNTPWAGRVLTGRVRHTLFQGEPVVVDAEATR